MSQAQMMNIEWRYSKAIFDPNQWHEMTEARVDWLFRTPFSSNFHSLDDASSTLEIKGIRPQVWQMLPVDGVAGRYVMRSNYTGPEQQVATCYKGDETDDSKTGICLRDSTGEDNQKWDIEFVETTGSTYIFRNVANSSDFVLDCHPGNPIFMNKNFDPANNPAQHWILRPDGEINDDSYSTTYTALPAGATNKPLPTDTGSESTAAPKGTTRGPAGSSATGGSDAENSSGSDSSSSSQLSAGAVAGIGIAAAIGVLLIAAIAFALLRRRRNRQPGTPFFGGPAPRGKAQEMEGSPGAGTGVPGSAAVGATTWHPQAKSPESERSVLANAPPNNAYAAGGYVPQQQQQQQQYQQQQYQNSQYQNTTPSMHPGTSQSPSSFDQNSYGHGPVPMTARTGTWSSNDKGSGTMDMMSPLGGYQMSPQQQPPMQQQFGHQNMEQQRPPVHEAMDTGIPSQELDSTPLEGTYRSPQ